MATATKTEPRLYHFLSTTEVQHFLNNIGGRPFTVIFMKKYGEQRKLTGTLDTKSTERKNDVPICIDPATNDWRQFNIGRVLWIQEG